MPISILIVEDEMIIAAKISLQLTELGYEVAGIMPKGEAAIAHCLESRPDLILMDLSLPVIDGWEATRQIKADPATQAIPVIALTAHAMAGDEQKALEAGCDDYDTKPVNFKRLLGKIEKFLTTG